MHQIDKHRRELSIPGVCRHHKLKRCHACMHSQLLLSSPLVSTNTTISNSSVVGGRQCSRHSVSQSVSSQSDETDVCSPLPQSSTCWSTYLEADLQSWSVSQGKLQQHTANSQKGRLQTSRKCDGNGKLHYRR